MKKTKWFWNASRQEFEANGVGHPPWWKVDGIHGCNGGCGDADFPGRRPVVGDVVMTKDGSSVIIAHELPACFDGTDTCVIIDGVIPDGWLKNEKRKTKRKK